MLKVIENPTQDEVIALLGAFAEKTTRKRHSTWKPRSRPKVMICSISHLVWCWVILHYSRTSLPSFSKHPSQGCFMNTWRTGDTNISSCSKSLPLFVLPLCPKEMRLILELLRRNWWRLHSLTGLNLFKKASSTVHLSDKGSRQYAINEFIQAYGPVDMPFC